MWRGTSTTVIILRSLPTYISWPYIVFSTTAKWDWKGMSFHGSYWLFIYWCNGHTYPGNSIFQTLLQINSSGFNDKLVNEVFCPFYWNMEAVMKLNTVTQLPVFEGVVHIIKCSKPAHKSFRCICISYTLQTRAPAPLSAHRYRTQRELV